MSPEKREVLEIIAAAQEPIGAAEIYEFSTLLEKRQQAYSFCNSLRNAGLIEVVDDDDYPKCYRVTDAGRAELNSVNRPSTASDDAHNQPRLPECLAQRLAAHSLPQPEDPDEIRGAIDVLEDLTDTLERHFPEYEDDIRLLKTGSRVLRQLCDFLTNDETEEAA